MDRFRRKRSNILLEETFRCHKYHAKATITQSKQTGQVGVLAENATVYSPYSVQKALSYEKPDSEFQVYTFKQSRYRNGFWIGSGTTGLFYYSFTNSKLQHVNETFSPPTTEIHALHEANDTTLYLATSGLGLRKMTFNKGTETVSVKDEKQFHFFYEQKELTMFYSMVAEGDSILWLGSRKKAWCALTCALMNTRLSL